MESFVISVSELNQYIKERLDGDPALNAVCVRGEISNYKLYPSGHHYFTLKDDAAVIRCVMFRSSAASLRFRPENGMAVLAIGRVSVFPRDGAYQLYCSRLTPDGAGELHTAFEQLKKKLFEEGLFDKERKRTLPAYPHRIALITSPAGAAVHDMLRILNRRYPLSRVLLLPVRVQGAEAAGEISAAIRYANEKRLADVIITGRGGGSLEDLWAFNEEPVARAIAASQIPVVSAVGHEPDVTISDFVADLRAATPSNAAELVAPDQNELRLRLRKAQSAMEQAMRTTLAEKRAALDRIRSSRALQSPLSQLQDKRQRLDGLTDRLRHLYQLQIAQRQRELSRLSASLDAMSPLKVLSRGYSIVTTEDGAVVRSYRGVAPGDRITVRTGSGTIRADVVSAEEETL